MSNKFLICNKGFFYNDRHIDMTGSDFLKKIHDNDTEDSSGYNCIVYYSYIYAETAFVQQIEIWLTKDKQPLTDSEYEQIEKLQTEVGFSYNYSIKLNAYVHYKSKTGYELEFPSGYEYNDYSCVYMNNTKIGLRCLFIIKNNRIKPVYDKKVREARFPELARAILKNDYDSVLKLINEGADVNFLEYTYLITPLKLALDMENVLIAKTLISSGASYDIFKLIREDNQALKILLQCGVDPDYGIKDIIFSPLIYAVYCENITAVKLLLDSGADPNLKTFEDGTALYTAVYLNLKEIAGLLIEYGADVNSITGEKSILRLAMTCKHPDEEMIRLIQFCGGKLNFPTFYDNEEENILVRLPDTFIPVINNDDIDFISFLIKSLSEL